jgi:hypothetical protein
MLKEVVGWWSSRNSISLISQQRFQLSMQAKRLVIYNDDNQQGMGPV